MPKIRYKPRKETDVVSNTLPDKIEAETCKEVEYFGI